MIYYTVSNFNIHMNNKIILTIVLFVIIVGGFVLFSGDDAMQDASVAEEMSATEMVEEAAVPLDEEVPAPPVEAVSEVVEESEIPAEVASLGYTLADISLHATPGDCWFAMEGKVYDVTEYIAGGLHPGEEAILEGCGKDATILYTQDPDESGNENSNAHSAKARNFLENYYIGELE
jgi:cytochrome b involved in lipid metabolism